MSIRSTTTMMAFAPKYWLIVVVVYTALGVLVFLGSCLQHRLKSPSHIVKVRARMMLLGFGISASLPIIDYVINAFFQIYIFPGFNWYLPFFIAFPAFIGFSIVRHDLFHFDTIIKRTYGYVLTTASLAGIYGIFVLVSNLAFGRYEITQSRLFPIFFMLGVVFFFNPIRDRVQRIIDRLFYRLEYDYRETVRSISETMRSLLKVDEIGQRIIDTAMQTMYIDVGCVYLLDRKAEAYACVSYAGECTLPGLLGSDTPASESIRVTQHAERVDTKSLHSGDRRNPSAHTSEPLILDDPLIEKIDQRKRAVTIYDVQEDDFFKDNREVYHQTFEKLEATLIVPLIYENKLTGLIVLGRKKSGKFYRKEDITLLSILANQGAVAFENANMIEEVIEKERMEEELNIARDLQVSMLPAECPEIEGLEIAAYSV
jgi:hypothetical protein